MTRYCKCGDARQPVHEQAEDVADTQRLSVKGCVFHTCFIKRPKLLGQQEYYDAKTTLLSLHPLAAHFKNAIRIHTTRTTLH
eukprot:3422030-Rhodomonas_salina.1